MDKLQSAPRRWLTTIRGYLLASAALHLVWESLQLPLYTLWRTGKPNEIAFAVVHCTVGDVIIASLALLLSLLASLLVIGRNGPADVMLPVSTAAVGIGAAYTVHSEWVNTVVLKNWTYSDQMPLVPGLGVGLSPLLQWLIVPTISFVIAYKLTAKKPNAKPPPIAGMSGTSRSEHVDAIGYPDLDSSANPPSGPSSRPHPGRRDLVATACRMP